MKHKTAELSGALLDAAAAKAEGYELDSDGDNLSVRELGGAPSSWHPSTDWRHGGPLIQREGIAVWQRSPGEWEAFVGAVLFDYDLQSHDFMGTGPTLLVAAMRAFVLAKVGPEVDLP